MEVVERVTEFGLNELGLKRIQGLVMVENQASIRVLERNGYIREGLLHNYPFGREFHNVVMSICMAVSLGLPLNILFIVKTMVLSTILAIATPPIPGGAITCFTIILSELGISLEVLPLVITVDIFLDYVATGTDVVSLQHLLLVFAKKKR